MTLLNFLPFIYIYSNYLRGSKIRVKWVKWVKASEMVHRFFRVKFGSKMTLLTRKNDPDNTLKDRKINIKWVKKVKINYPDPNKNQKITQKHLKL